VSRRSPAPAPHADGPALERRLGPLDAAAVIVSNVIGGGILFTPPLVAAMIPHPWLFLGVWAVGGALAFAGAMAYAELAALRPRAGGEYVYFREAYGRLAAFFTGWTSFVAGFSGAIAASSVFLAIYLDRFFPGAGSTTELFRIPLPWVPLIFSNQALIAVSTIVLMSWIHLRGVGPGRLMGNILAALKVTALLLFIAAGFSYGAGSVSNLQQGAGSVTATAWVLALIPVMFAYSGWNAAGYIAEEIRDPGRNVPRALALGTIAVIAIYVLLNLLYLFVLPVDRLAQVKGSVLDVIADGLFDQRAGNIMGIVSIISLAASISANVFAGPRVYYAMARDGLFLPAAARIHPRFKTPASAIIAQAVWSSVLVLTGSGETLTNYTGFSIILFGGIAVGALFVLRQREPDAPRPFRALGYPIAPAIFVIAMFLIVCNALWRDLVVPVMRDQPWGPSAAGLIVIGLGLPVYLLLGRRAAANRTQQ
jgi:APA family basic amino acid/polyamine antiporter